MTHYRIDKTGNILTITLSPNHNEDVQKYLKRFKAVEHIIESAVKKLNLIHEAYDDNFKKIMESKKLSHEHLKYLVVEDALNESSKRIRQRVFKNADEDEETKDE